MKDSRKKSYFKIAAGLLSTVMALSIVPIQSLAAVSDSIATISENTVVSKNDDNLSNVIIREVVEERDEFSKTYLMSDGTYYTCISSVAIHQFSEDSWENIDDSLNFSPETITDVETKFTDFAEAVKSSSTSSTFALYDTTESITVTCIGTSTETDGKYSLGSNGALVIKPNNISNFSANNKIILSAELKMTTSKSFFNYNRALYLKEITEAVSANTTYSNISSNNNIYYDIYEQNVTSYSFDITDIYSKWERNIMENNGVALIGPAFNATGIAINDIFISLQYKDASFNNGEYTYHTLDLGKAGTISINDITNAFKLEQTLIGVNSHFLPVTLTRTLYSNDFSVESIFDLNSMLNYSNYSLSVESSFATLILPDGTKIEFEHDENATAPSNYQIWKQSSFERNFSDMALYVYIVTDADHKESIVLDQSYFVSDELEYWFNENGKLSHIKEGNKTLSVNYSEDSLEIEKITDGSGNQYYFTYSTYNLNNQQYSYISKIAAKNSDNTAILFGDSPLELNISYTETTDGITNTYTFFDGSTVSYNYTLSGVLTSIIGTDGIETTLNYKNLNNTFLTGYSQSSDGINLSISSDNTFERKFSGSNTENEIQRYDTNFKLITHYYGNNVICMTYDESGLVNSYVMDNKSYTENMNYIVNGDFSSNPFVNNTWRNLDTGGAEYQVEENGNGLIKIQTNGTATQGIDQVISEISADRTYVFSAEALIDTSIPSHRYDLIVNIKIYDLELLEQGVEEVKEIITLPFDLSLLCEWQVRKCAFKFDFDACAQVTICNKGNLGTVYVDNVRLYEALPEEASVDLPGITISDPVTQTIENGLVTSETISNGFEYMQQNYEYNSSTNNMISLLDYNGVASYYDYSARNGLLTKKGTKVSSNDSILDPIEYSYSNDLLTRVSQIVETATGNNVVHIAEYAYDANSRVVSVNNNSYKYTFEYDSLGNITNINKTTKNGAVTSANTLIDYEYNDGNLGSIEYANGYKINYIYNEDGSISQINCLKPINGNETIVASYSYTYENDAIKETLMSFDDLEYDVKVVNNESSIDTYHVLNGVSTLVYSKTQNKTYTEEVYSATNNTETVTETFKRTEEVETKNGSNTELFAAFEGRKSSILNTGVGFAFEGSNNTIKDYFGRTISKSFDLEEQIIDNSTSTPVGNLSLTQNFTYKSFDEVTSEEGTRTTNLVSSISNEFTGADADNNTIQNAINYHYIYDDRGNIKFEYIFDDGYYILSKYYQYDEANQLVSCVGYDYNAFYLYDNNGNLTEKMLDCDAIIEGINDDVADFTEIPASGWDEYDWSLLDNMKVVVTSASTTIHYTYDSLGRLINYKEQDYGEDSADVDINIGYDAYGNPLKYIGEDINGQSIIADLTWNGTLLESALIYSGTAPSKKIVFEYDVNGYRINKTIYEYDNETSTFNKQQSTDYIWDNGILMGIKVLLADECSYTNILYDTTGVPYGITTPIGFAYYFLRDVSNSIRGLVDARGNIIATMDYDEFGNINFNIEDDNILTEIINTLAVYYNPCTYKGYMYDYELGMYFIKDKCYAPQMACFLNETSLETLTEVKDKPLDINTKLCCNNNMVNGVEKCAEWNRDNFTFASNNIEVDMSIAFLSRPFCTIYATNLLNTTGTWDYRTGKNIYNMSVEHIASNLFARSVGNYAENAINKVNTTWGDGWISSNRNSTKIVITENDPNADKYSRIWNAAPSIKNQALADGIIITL